MDRAGATWIAAASAWIPHPHLWSLGNPVLYRAALTLSDALGRPLGGYVTYSGIRRIAVTRDGRLSINGRRVSLRGVELREQDLRLGAALDPAHLRRLFGRVRALGATVIRSDPLNPQIEEMADRQGVLIWSDIPVSDHVLNRPAWMHRALMTLRDNILTNQNHPSILLWGIGNELPAPATNAEAAHITGAVALAHRLDPTRPVGMSVTDWPGLACQPAYAPLDVLGVNEYFGWYNAGGGATDDRVGLSPFLDGFRACYPKQALFVSEFGFESNRSGPAEERGTYQFQADAAAYHLAVFASKPWLSGAIYSLLQDSVSAPGFRGGNPRPDPPFDHKGLLDLHGNPKQAWNVVASIYRTIAGLAAPRYRHRSIAPWRLPTGT